LFDIVFDIDKMPPFLVRVRKNIYNWEQLQETDFEWWVRRVNLIRLALSSVSNQAIIPLQDIFSLGSDARMNTPGLAEGNWGWRYRTEALTSEYSTRLRDMVMIYGRYQGF
jgi:4-alpha-glucanotransferase